MSPKASLMFDDVNWILESNELDVIPVRFDPSPLKDVAVTVPSTVTPVEDVANLGVLAPP